MRTPTVRPYIFSQPLLSANLLRSIAEAENDDASAGAQETPPQEVPQQAAAPTATFAAQAQETVQAQDAVQAQAPTPGTVPSQPAADDAPPPDDTATAGPAGFDDEAMAKAAAWEQYSLHQLHRIGPPGNAFSPGQMEAVKGLVDQTAHHLQSLLVEATQQGRPETVQFLQSKLEGLNQLWTTYASLPAQQTSSAYNAYMYQRQAIMDMQNQDLQANYRNTSRISAVLSPNNQMMNGMQMPGMGMPGMGMPGMGMPGMMPGMGMPGMGMSGMGMSGMMSGMGMPMTSPYPSTMYPQTYPGSVYPPTTMAGYPATTYPTSGIPTPYGYR